VPEPSTAEADRIVMVPKLIGEHIQWVPVMHGKNTRWTLAAHVIAPGTT